MAAADPINTPSVLRLLRSQDPEEVAAAALLLAHLRPRGPRVLNGILAALRVAGVPTRPYILAALGALPGRAATDRVVELLCSEGSSREQAVEILAQRAGVMPALVAWRRRQKPDADLSALVAVYEQRADDAAVRALLALLPAADFLTARRVYGAVERFAEAGTPATVRKLSTLTLAAWPRVRKHTTGRIAVLKMLTVLKPAAARALLHDALQDDAHAAVKRAALELAAALPMKRTDRKLAARLLELLADPSAAALRADVVLCLLRCSGARHAEAQLELLFGGDSNTALAAVALIPHMSPKATEAGLRLALSHADERVVAAGGRLLAAQPQLPHAMSFDFLAAALPERCAPGAGAITTLAACDRERACTLCAARASAALRCGDVAAAIHWLEPLVRARLADPTCRTLLAIAWARTPAATQPLGTPRTLQILGPLVRLQGFDAAPLLLDATLLPQDARVAVAALLAQRGKPERSLAARISI